MWRGVSFRQTTLGLASLGVMLACQSVWADKGLTPFQGPGWLPVPGQQIPVDKIKSIHSDDMHTIRTGATTSVQGPAQTSTLPLSTATSDLYPAKHAEFKHPAMPSGSVSPVHQATPSDSLSFSDGVKAYRLGDYLKAQDTFMRLTQGQPNSVNNWYYLALTNTQLGEWEKARVAYEVVIEKSPKSGAAKLAKEGLANLDRLAESDLDLPPSVNTAKVTSAPSRRHYPKANTIAASQAPQRMNNSDLTELQRIRNEIATMKSMGTMNSMGGMSGNQMNQNSNDAMSWMNPAMGGVAPNGMNSMGQNAQTMMSNPQMMKSMLMTQMMQGFSGQGK